MLIRQKKKVKGILIVSIFISIMFLSNLQALFIFNPIVNQEDGAVLEKDDSLQYSYESDLSDRAITGDGTIQEVRAFFINQSESLDRIENFNISAPTNEMKLSSGDFNFTFQNNYTTEYIIENDDALNPIDSVESYQFNESFSNITINNGTNPSMSEFEDLLTENNINYTLVSENNILNITLKANYSGIASSNPTQSNLDFNRMNILNFLLYLKFSINESVDLFIQMKNLDGNWINISNFINIDKSAGYQFFGKKFINENLEYIDQTDVSYIQLVFVSTNDFRLELDRFLLNSIVGFELDISKDKHVALEFDLRGESTRVNGFSAWIRTLNATYATNENSILNISLYRADKAIPRTEDDLRTNLLVPDNNSLLDSIVVPYLSDNLTYFEFNLANTTELSYYNYIIVIKSNATEGVYSLVTLQDGDYGDTKTEHQLQTSSNQGGSWENAQTVVGALTADQLDASSFKLNITRGFIPSDFNGTLKIQDLEIDGKEIEFFPFTGNDPDYIEEWGKATWTHDFATAIFGNLNNDFQVNLTWDNDIINGFEFNVSYIVEAYKMETATSTYSVKYDGTPEWNLSYSFNPNLSNWNFTEFWYIYPNTMTPHNMFNITNPDSLDLFVPTEVYSFPENSYYNIYKAKANLANGSFIGLFSLNLTSYNCINDMHSYINFDGTLWESKGFMYGDNISIKVDLQNQLTNAPLGGNANATLFQDGLEYGSLNSSYGDVSSNNKILSYDFNNRTILNFTNNDKIGSDYYIGYFWTNGTEIGCKKLMIYLEGYDVIMDNCTYLPYSNMNSLTGLTTESLYNNYSLLIGSVNETTGISRPGYYPIERDVNENYYYNIPYTSETLGMSLINFKQSENIINPEETVNFRIQMKNLKNVFSYNVKVQVQLVSYSNNEWIINETTSDPVYLESINGTDKIAEFEITLRIPTFNANTKIWKGLNSPIRMGGVTTIFSVYIEDDGQYHGVGSFISTDYSLLVNQKENEFEGHILALKTREEFNEGAFTQDFERNECLYSQHGSNSTFIINSYTRFYTSSYNQSIEFFSLKVNSNFESITTDPVIIYSDTFQVNSVLKTEFGTILTGEDVTIQYMNGSAWEDISSQETDINGETNFEIDTSTINVGDSFTLKLSWLGNETIENCSKEISINKVVQSNDIDFTFSITSYTIYKRSYNYYRIQLRNNGTSVMNISINKINVEVTGGLATDLSYITPEMQYLAPGDSTILTIKIYCGDVSINQVNVNISIIAINLRSLQTVTFKSSILSLVVIDPPILANLSGIISILIVLIIIAAWIISIFYARRTQKNIESSLEKPVQKPKFRRGKYMKVSEIKPTTIEEKKKAEEIIKEDSKIEKEPKQTTDLDSLLEEEGLHDKTTITKKKQKSTQLRKVVSKAPKTIDPTYEKLNKMNLKKLRVYCKDRKIKIPSNATKSQIIQKILSSKKKKK